MLFFWYPPCSTCRRAMAWLDERSIPYTARHMKDEPPTVAELTQWLGNLPLKRLFNTSGLSYRALGLKDKLADLSVAEQLALLAGDGMLVKRPVLVGDGFVLTGFRPEQWAQVL